MAITEKPLTEPYVSGLGLRILRCIDPSESDNTNLDEVRKCGEVTTLSGLK
jgi:hypothetical protein